MWCQEVLILLAVMIALLRIMRRPSAECTRLLGTTAMVVAPWLTNGETVVIALATGGTLTRVVFSTSIAVSIGAGLVWWRLARKASSIIGTLLLVIGFLVMLASIYWLNSNTTTLLQVLVMGSAALLLWEALGNWHVGGDSPQARTLPIVQQ
jgi:hypothetical protein